MVEAWHRFLLLSVFLAVMSSFAAADIRVDEEFSFDGENSYSPNATFVGNSVEFLEGCPVNCTLEDSSGDVLGYATSPYGTVDTANASVGRAVVYNTSDRSQNVSIDLFSNSSDVVGRFRSGNLSLYYWRNGSEIPPDTPNFNWSTGSWADSEKVFRLNYTNGKKYFIGVNKTPEKQVVEATEAYTSYQYVPRINDFNLTGLSNITGRVRNSSGPVADLKLRLSRVSVIRFPHYGSPPTKHAYTNGSGYYRFTGLQPGSSYKIEVVNKSYHRYPYRAYNSTPAGLDTDLSRSTELTEDFNVTSDVGNLSVMLQADQAPKTSYAVFAAAGSQGYYNFTKLVSGVEPGSYVNLSLPTANYTLIAVKVDYSGSLFEYVTRRTFSEVSGSNRTFVETGFPDRVKLTGVVKNEAGQGVSNIQVLAQNDSLSISEYARTRSDGSFTLEVRNNTGVTLTVSPGHRSSYTANSTNVTVKGATVQNLTVSEGPYIEGYIKDVEGERIEGARVTAWNWTYYSSSSNISTGGGYFKLGGLRAGTVYEVSVNADGYPSKEVTVNLTGQSETRNISLKDRNYTISGNIHDSKGEAITATVTLSSVQDFEQSKTVTGSYSFSGLDRGYYALEVDPRNTTYEEKRDYAYITSSKTLNFTLRALYGLSGHVKGSEGQSLSDVFIYAYNDTKDSYDSDRTDSDGDYRLELPPGSHQVEIWPGADSSYKSMSTTVSISGESSQRDFTLSKGAYLTGRVYDPGGKNFSGYISLYNSSRDAFSYSSFNEGVYNLTGLSEVDYSAYVYVEGRNYSSRTFSVDSSELDGKRDFKFGKDQGPKLRVVVRNPSGSRVSNASVVVEGQKKLTGLNGVAAFGRQPDNREAYIMVKKEGYNTSTADPKLQNTKTVAGVTKNIEIYNQTMTIENVDDQLVDLSVNLTDSNGVVEGATVVASSLEPGSALSASGVTDSDGNATLEGLMPGSRYLTSVTVDGNISSRNITFSPGEENISSIENYQLGYEVPEN